jgi:flagellar biogenesis protein FliO
MKLAAFLFKKFKYYLKHYFDPEEDDGYSYQQVRTMLSLIIGAFLFVILIIYIIKRLV